MSILTPPQKNFLDEFFTTRLGKEFFLGGGTALAEFYLQHRLSQDLDLFTLNQELGFNVANAEMLKIIHRLNLQIENQVTSRAFLQYILTSNKDENLKIDLIKDVPLQFGDVQKFNSYRVDSLENIAVGKLLATFGRADGKDFIDLYFLLEVEKKIKFDRLLELAKQKDTGLHELYLAEMLAMVENIEIFPKTLKPFNVEEMKAYFLDLSEDLLKKIKPPEPSEE